jgi:molybdopterin synthase sulfur carrier subunit
MNPELNHTIEVHYFAMLREKAGTSQESVQVSSTMSYADLYRLLAHKHQFKLSLQEIQVAVNDEFTDLNDSISKNAKIVFIPPVAGG